MRTQEKHVPIRDTNVKEYNYTWKKHDESNL